MHTKSWPRESLPPQNVAGNLRGRSERWAWSHRMCCRTSLLHVVGHLRASQKCRISSFSLDLQHLHFNKISDDSSHWSLGSIDRADTWLTSRSPYWPHSAQARLGPGWWPTHHLNIPQGLSLHLFQPKCSMNLWSLPRAVRLNSTLLRKVQYLPKSIQL